VREPQGRGERLALRALPGALARAESWQLDDLEPVAPEHVHGLDQSGE